MYPDYDVVGEGGEDEMVLGATPNYGMAKRFAMQGRPGLSRITAPRPTWMSPSVSPQGVSAPKEEMDILPFNSVTLLSTALTGQFISFPQRPFRGERIIATATLFTGGAPSDASDLVFIDPAMFVGAVQVGASQGRIPLSVFRANAFGVRLSFPTAGQGTRVLIPILTLFPIPVGDAIACSFTIIGKAVR